MKIESISQVVSKLGESPIYSQTTGEVAWTDITGLKWIRYNIRTCKTNLQASKGMISALAFREKNGLIAAVQEGFATLNEHEEYVITNHILGRNERMNDGKCDPKGRFWAGSTDLNFEKSKGKLFRLDTEFKCEEMLTGLTLPNGMDWSPDEKYFFLIDSLDYKLWRFDFEVESGLISNKVVFYEFNPDDGIPDGLSISSAGYILVAKYGGSSLSIISPKGELSQTIMLPVKNPTSLTFVGSNLEDLIVTSAHSEIVEEKLNLNGQTLLVSNFGHRGKKAYCFGG